MNLHSTIIHDCILDIIRLPHIYRLPLPRQCVLIDIDIEDIVYSWESNGSLPLPSTAASIDILQGSEDTLLFLPLFVFIVLFS